MNLKDELLALSYDETYALGIKHHRAGYAITADPFRNLPAKGDISKRQALYVKGWRSEDDLTANKAPT
jgi:hypothetical protein